MKVKKIRAGSMPEAMKLVRSELGNDAIILNSRVVMTGGFLGFFKKRRIEVVAALDSPNINGGAPSKEATPTQDNMVAGQGKQEALEVLPEMKPSIKTVQYLNNHVNEDAIPLPKPIAEAKQLLLKQELSGLVIDEVLQTIIKIWYKQDENLSFDDVMTLVKQGLIKKISHLPFGGISFSKKFINVVGPTGVGKTTTLAKIAAFSILSFKKKVAFITTDTYRIAAIEQLKTYANILNVPVEVCYNLDDFQQAKNKFDEYDLVFIDTAGRNFRNPKYVSDLKGIIDFNHEMETLLVLSLASKQSDMEEINHQFSCIDIDRFIFTKADETSTYGAMFNMIHQENRAVAYITNGQNVPDDLVTVTPEDIVDYIVGAD
ncbi:flagellar biosynthesis protein FlhF [Niallia sp. Krafla_26]|uniref:flagellar biosynthesis protein FlhF n=1 Tax=Niallia sp. Krafla_26 TaxID=3064703 RepID=UPI003D1728B0